MIERILTRVLWTIIFFLFIFLIVLLTSNAPYEVKAESPNEAPATFCHITEPEKETEIDFTAAPESETETVAETESAAESPAAGPTEIGAIPGGKREYYGECRVTYYCSCGKCNGYDRKGNPRSYDCKGNPLIDGEYGTVAADTAVFPYGTVLYIEGVGYKTVRDTGGRWVKGAHIDIYTSEGHKAALAKCGGNIPVYVVREAED